MKNVKKIEPKVTQLYDEFLKEDHEEKKTEKEPKMRNKNLPAFSEDNLKFYNYKKQSENQRILRRLEKGTKWGLSGEILRQKEFNFPNNRLPNLKEIQAFLTKELLKDIEVIDMTQSNRSSVVHTAFLVTGFSAKHIHKSAKNLVRALQNIEVEIIPNPVVKGNQIYEWFLVNVGSWIEVHLMTEQTRKEIKLKEKWMDLYYCNLTPPNDDEWKKMKRTYTNPFKFKDINKQINGGYKNKNQI